ncbi:hypothetical protein N0V93_002755 [Gnomoniopsis smithogilvyi]|uniref:Erythromycin biosynthesis protein CIII-like C-terminal domain-containing protein n=1 Tax=Gnomoniopsis smithogilvyi TaxID=1191159 RepID=A0A9W8YY54_9PEZI|nr:hypothetical protein N0V93_002755 [Gnomoniopsis smithogilvyi]
MADSFKPAVLYAAPPREGHMRPALQICSYLVARGFDVTLLGSQRWKPTIEATGAYFGPVIGLWNSLDDRSRWPSIALQQDAKLRLRAALGDGFTMLLPSGFQSLFLSLMEMRRRLGKRKIVILTDTCFAGTMCFKLDTDLPPEFEDSVGDISLLGIGVVPSHWVSPERPPWGSGLPFDNSPAGRERNMKAHAEAYNQEAEDRARMILTMLDCRKPLDDVLKPYAKEGLRRPLWDAVSVINDTTLQMGLASLEYPADDWPSHMKFAGHLPRLETVEDTLIYPNWWDEITSNSPKAMPMKEARKRIVFVAQGTEILDYNKLIVPTIRGLADRSDLIVIAVLCVRGGNLDRYLNEFPDGVIPSNVHVLDYFPYDAALAHADLFISNSGYGGLTHAIANAVPMLQNGDDFDKADIGRRVEYAGLGTYLGGPPPTPDMVAEAVDELFSNDKYKRRAQELRAEAEAESPLEAVEREIMALA